MADPWAAFRLPGTNAQALVQNDPPADTSQRAPIPSSNKVWGDKEAEAAGLYETPGGDPWAAFRVKQNAAPEPAYQERGPNGVPRLTVSPVEDRFAPMEQPSGDASALQRGLKERAGEMTMGQRLSPVAQQAIGFDNIRAAASQGTDPNADRYDGNLVSNETFESDAGEILYRDPADGKVKPTNTATQVAIRDPRDGVVKVYNRTPETNENAMVGLSRVMASGMAAGAPTARPSIGTPVLRNATPRASEIFSTAKPYYKAFDNAANSISINTDTAVGYVTRIKDAMKAGRVPQHLAEEVYRSVDEIATGAPITASDLRSVKELIGQSSRSNDARVRQAAGIASKEIVKIIGELNKGAAENLKTADKIYGTAKSVQQIQRGKDIAQLRAGRAGYGGNAVNSMRQVLSPIVQRSIEGKVTGFQPAELAAMREIVEGTPATNAARMVGALSPSKGIMQIAVGGATGGATAALGAASNKIATVLTGQQIERLNELVAKRSPAYAKAVEKAIMRYSDAQEAFASNPSPQKFAALISASRALSSGFQKDGIAITSGDLLRAIQGPMKSAAEEEQPSVPRGPGQ